MYLCIVLVVGIHFVAAATLRRRTLINGRDSNRYSFPVPSLDLCPTPTSRLPRPLMCTFLPLPQTWDTCDEDLLNERIAVYEPHAVIC